MCHYVNITRIRRLLYALMTIRDLALPTFSTLAARRSTLWQGMHCGTLPA